MSIIHDVSPRVWSPRGWLLVGVRPGSAPRRVLMRLLGFKLSALDFAIALARKVAGFCSLLALGWMYFKQLVLGQSLHQMFPGIHDPDLRQTMWVALLLILAIGWDIPNEQIATYWDRFHERLPGDGLSLSAVPLPTRRLAGALRCAEPIVARLACFMDLCVAVANKVGALAVLGYMAYLGWHLGVEHVPLRAMYPEATDPTVSLLADICVYVVVLAWWAMPMEQIAIFWRRLHQAEVARSAGALAEDDQGLTRGSASDVSHEPACHVSALDAPGPIGPA